MLFAYRVFKLQKETLNNVVTKVGEERGPQPKKKVKKNSDFMTFSVLLTLIKNKHYQIEENLSKKIVIPFLSIYEIDYLDWNGSNIIQKFCKC